MNIIPDTATLQMGMRTYDNEARAHILERLPEIVDHYVKAWHGEYELVTFNCPCTYTDDAVSKELLPYIGEIVGDGNIEMTGPMAGTEDFSYVAEAVPSMFICLGAGGPDQYPHHNPPHGAGRERLLQRSRHPRQLRHGVAEQARQVMELPRARPSGGRRRDRNNPIEINQARRQTITPKGVRGCLPRRQLWKRKNVPSQCPMFS